MDDAPIKVFVDTSSVSYYPTGVSIYMLSLLRELLKMCDEAEVVSGVASIRPRVQRRICELLAEHGVKLPFSRIWLPGRIAAAFPRLGRLLAIPPVPQVDVVHATSYLPPAWVNADRLVVTVHDLRWFRFPQPEFTPWERLRQEMPAVAQRADAIVADSHATKRDVCEFLEVPEQRVFVAHLAPQEPWPDIDGHTTRAVLREWQLRPGDYFLTVAEIAPHKNYARLLEAFGRFHDARPDATLVVVGRYGWHAEAERKRIVEMAPAVRWIQGCTPEQLRALYGGARAFFLVSLYEGFGLPVVEAMSSGCPVCYATGSAMDEVAGEAGVAVDPEDVASIHEAMLSLWDDAHLRERLACGARERARLFTWERTARRTLEAYRYALAH